MTTKEKEISKRDQD